MRVTVLVVALVFVFSIRHSAFGIESFHWRLPRGLPVQRVAAFGAAFPREPAPVSLQNIVKSIASFERTLVSADSPFDRYLYRDDKNAMSAAALRGKDLFFSETLGCSECHASFNLSGPVTFERATRVEPLFHNTGLYNVNGRGAYPRTDRGLMDRTHNAADMGRFRAP